MLKQNQLLTSDTSVDSWISQDKNVSSTIYQLRTTAEAANRKINHKSKFEQKSADICQNWGCGTNSWRISRAISMLFCEMWSARSANIWSKPSATNCSTWRSVKLSHRAEFSLLLSWFSRSLSFRAGGEIFAFSSLSALLQKTSNVHSNRGMHLQYIKLQ